MREIKFRAWDQKKKKMLYEGYCDEFTDIWGSGSTHLGITFKGTIFGQIGDDGGKNGLHEHDADIPLNRFILMQYTGLKDKNGKEIYEGDIVAIDYTSRDDPVHGYYKEEFEIVWDALNAGFCRRDKNSRFERREDGYTYYAVSPREWADLEVIGNIYEGVNND